ncbi:hypothetical protein [Winogradskyella luteola]|uniref:Uncharacterized protein n=1 Tax=Winogradskyella luteola TaxID=2828330 RepID=A0A9X1FA69_9FLAO|nr:hypothetical protein [Winogradskyella luteola]MBV7270135.1 hypothetical protein [Winogradskyella luteola]
MKSILFLLALGFVGLFNSTEAQNQVVKDSLSISKLLRLSEKLDFEGYEIKFKKVITDSRCPKNVMCVRAGEAEVLLSIYKKGSFIEDKKIRIDTSEYAIEANNLAFDTLNFKAYGFGLMPYPEGVVDLTNKDYQLEVVFQPKVLK